VRAWLGLPLCAVLVSGCGAAGTASRTTVVPRLTPGYLDDAMALLQQRELPAVVASLPRVERGSWNENAYVVTRQAPAPGARVPVGTPVRLTLGISLNGGGPWRAPPKRTTVPDVRSWTINAAFGAVTSPLRGLRATIQDGDAARTHSFTEGILVVRSIPQAGSRVPAGTNVVLIVKRFGR
jgi:beta-lactam-binding protein with PASTA domain